MTRSRNTVKKVLIIYIIAGVLVAIIYMGYYSHQNNKDGVTYSFENEVANEDVSVSIEDTEEYGTVADATVQGTEEEPAYVFDDEVKEDTAKEESGEEYSKDAYYSYVTTNRYNRLNVRKDPSTEGEIIYKLAPGSRGYVLERGDKWSYIRTDKVDGYSSNTYLSFEELDKDKLPEDFPEDYR